MQVFHEADYDKIASIPLHNHVQVSNNNKQTVRTKRLKTLRCTSRYEYDEVFSQYSAIRYNSNRV